MKKILSFALMLVFAALTLQVRSQQTGQTATTPEPAKVTLPTSLKWESVVKDFGEIKQGIPATLDFTFTNNSPDPIIISRVQKSCGCTEPKFSQEPVLPKQSSTISATYNAAALGPFNKTLTVFTSNNETYTLVIKGSVVPKL